VAAGTRDIPPQIQGALSSGAQQFNIVGNTAFCVSALTALQILNYKGKVTINSDCCSAPLFKTIPGGTNGVLMPSTQSFSPKDRQVALYDAVMAHYASSNVDAATKAIMPSVCSTVAVIVTVMRRASPRSHRASTPRRISSWVELLVIKV